MKFKMAATAGLSLTLDPMGKMFQNASSLKPLGAFEYFPIGSNVNICPAVVAILDFRLALKHKICRGPSNDHSWCSLDGPLQSIGFLFRYEIQNGGYGRT
jgi:hypothetical protein